MEKLNFYNCLKLVEKAVENGILYKDKNNKDNILVYCSAGTVNGEEIPEGWRSLNAHTVAQDLLEDTEAQKLLINELNNKGIEFVPKALPSFYFDKE